MNYKELNIFRNHTNKSNKKHKQPQEDDVEINTYKKLFINFLKQRSILAIFKDRIEQDGSRTPNFETLINTFNQNHWILEAFTWSKTPEGSSYWQEIENEWWHLYNTKYCEAVR